MPDRILIAEDERELRALLEDELRDAGYDVVAFGSADAALRFLDRGETVDLVITDLIMPGTRGHELLRSLRSRSPEIHVIVITGFGSIDSAIEMVRAGAFEYLTKPFATDELLLAAERALADSAARREGARLLRDAAPPLPGFIGASRAMQEVFTLIRRASPSPHPVLVTGETGTGKELVARALHHVSGRGAFVVVNCAAFPENLLESELFGHQKGAFTGADRDKPGLFEAAHGGTLFLDEVGELPPPLQPKLLRALEDHEIRRLGSTVSRPVDVRVIAATNRALDDEVAAGRFRQDLLWRLNVIPVHVPPLRERAADVPLLVEHFLHGRAIAPDAMALLTAYPWPGNVRELRNAIERAATLGATDEIRTDDLPPRIRDAARSAALVSDASRRGIPLRLLERDYILEILRQVGGNKSRAAEILGLDRKTLYRKLEEYRVEQGS
jgi:two-component system NtrC family response regulator